MPSRMMRIATAHFGSVDVKTTDAFCFPLGIPGLEHCREWVLLTPPDSECVSWLQCVDRPEAALAVVDPRRFVPQYQANMARRDLECLQLESLGDARVLVTMNRTERGLTLDLRAPLVINMRRRLGRQVISRNDLPMQYPLEDARPTTVRRIA